MPLLADFRARLDLPSVPASTAERDEPSGFGPELGIILPGTFPPPAVAVPPGNQPTAPGLPKPYPPPGSQPPATPPKNLVGGRLSWDDQQYFGAGLPVILPPDLERDEWRRIDLDASRIKYLPTHQLLKVLVEASPDVSRALWDFLRLTNPGWTCVAYKPGTHTPLPAAQQELDAWTQRLRVTYGTVDVPIARLHFGAFLRGALFSELVLDESGRTAMDLVTPDPITARFRQVIDPVYGRKWALGQYQLGTFVDLSVRQTISYIPIDPAPANPYGRPPCAPAVFASLFLIGLLHDLRRVVAQQGYPRYDLSIVIEQLKKATPQNIIQNPVEWKQWVDQTIADVQQVYAQLQPDDAFVHTDVVAVNRPTGAISAEALSGIDPLIRALERQLARALKTMPLLMGIIEGQSEANANRQWELQAAGIKAIQHLSESQLSQWANLVCQAKGIQAECFPAGTLVMSESGPIPIEQVGVGTRVLTHTGRWMPVTQTGHRIAATMVLRGQGHFGLEATHEHPFYSRRMMLIAGRRGTRTLVCAQCAEAFETRDFRAQTRFCCDRCRRAARSKGKAPQPQANPAGAPPPRWQRTFSEPKWVPAAELTGAYWATPIRSEALPTPALPAVGGRWDSQQRQVVDTPDFWWLVGRWLGDGLVRLTPVGRVFIVCGLHESDALEVRLRQLNVPLRWRRRDTRTGTIFETSTSTLARWLHRHFGALAGGKTLPGWVLGMSVASRQALLEGYISADGLSTPKRGRRQAIVTISKTLAIGTRLLAESLGHHVGLSYRPPVPEHAIEGKPTTQRGQYRLEWMEQPRHSFTISDGEHAWSRVAEVVPGARQVRVYNLEVGGDNSYVADGMVVHNCEWKFAELRAAETYRDAMTEGLQIDNVTKKWLMGWIGQKEAAHEVTGEEPDQDQPRLLPSNESAYDPNAKATTTGSPRADGQPAGSKPGDNTGGDNADVGDSKDPNARRPFDVRLRWPSLPFARQRVAAAPAEPWRPQGQPLAPLATDPSFDESDRARVLHAWDDEMPEYAGLLDAQPAVQEDEDEAELRRLLAETEHQPSEPPANGHRNGHTPVPEPAAPAGRQLVVIQADDERFDALRQEIQEALAEQRERLEAGFAEQERARAGSRRKVHKTVKRDDDGRITEVIEEVV